jgi:ABC-type amino acid transport system permease subunit
LTFDPTILTPYLGDLAAGARLTALACALALTFGLALGMLIALMRTAASPLARRAANIYVDIFRNVPSSSSCFSSSTACPRSASTWTPSAPACWRCRWPAAPSPPT